LLLLAFVAHEGRKSFTSLAIVLGLIALAAQWLRSAGLKEQPTAA